MKNKDKKGYSSREIKKKCTTAVDYTIRRYQKMRQNKTKIKAGRPKGTRPKVSSELSVCMTES